MNSFLHQASFATGYWCYDRHRSVRLVVLVGLAIDQIAQSGLSSLSVIYYSAQLFSPAAQAGAIGAIKSLAGTAAGLSMFISMFLAILATQFIAEFNSGSPLVISFSLFLLTFLSLIFAIITLKKPQ
ncbi:hypothetical protein I4519_27165 [Klebsiella pneumoniae]|nr:hypothetical protein [Klebsiella pneumoniae]